MIVNLYAFSKKKNSTKQPSAAGATVLNGVQLKDETSVLAPVLLLNEHSQGMPVPFTPSYFTYAYIPKFSRYYFITDWRWVNGLWECYLTVDVLASFKAAIGSTSAYVERSASAYNGNVIDNLYPGKADVNIVAETIATSWANVAPSGGCYVLGVIDNQSSNHVGAITYYAMEPAQLNTLLVYLFSSNIFNASTITEVGEGLFKAMFNPFQYIVSCMWFPAAASTYGTTYTKIWVGYWETDARGYLMQALTDVRYITGYITEHPQAASRGAYLNYSNYTRITLFCPPFGEIPIDPVFTRSGRYLYAKVMIDTITGQATLRVCFRTGPNGTYSNKPCIEKTAMMGVPIQLAQVLIDYSSGISSLVNGLASGSAEGIIGGMLGATINTALATQMPKVSTNGANGSFINFALEPNLVTEHTLLVSEDNADLGRPLMETRTLNTLSGYIQCAEGHFSGSCFDSERDAINSFLVGGFFYE